MRRFVALILIQLLPSLVWASLCKDVFAYKEVHSRSMSQLLDVRVFNRSKSSNYGHPLFYKISNGRVSLDFGLNRINEKEVVLNLTIDSGRDSAYISWLTNVLKNQLGVFATRNIEFKWQSNTVLSVRFDAQYHRQIREKVQNFFSDLNRVYLPPAETLPQALNNRSKSERVQFIRQLLTDFLVEQRVTDIKKFYDRNLSLIHRMFIENLSEVELTIFHYSIFDKDMTHESKTNVFDRIDRINEVQRKFGQPLYEAEAIVSDIQGKLIGIARSLHSGFAKKEKELQEARETLLSYRLEKYEQKIRALSEKLRDLRYGLSTLEYVVVYGKTRRFSREEDPSGHKQAAETDRIALARKKYYAIVDEIRETKDQLRKIEHDRRDRIEAFTEAERAAFSIIESDWISEKESRVNSNFNPYSLSPDHVPISFQAHAKRVIKPSESASSSKRSEPATGGVAENLARQSGANKGVLENDNYGSVADMNIALSKTDMMPSVVDLLRSVGITRLFEITNYSARDFIEKHNFSRDQMEKLLDELNVLGIDLYFDAKWDAANHRIRRDRPEYYRHRHTPHLMGKWREGLVPEESPRNPQKK